MVDGDRIRQVLANLVDNALRYTPKDRTIMLRVVEENQAVKVSVIDTGSGIASDDLPYVFDRFYRGDRSRTRSSGGSGLGLAIVRQIVEAHGGSVGVVSPAVQPDGSLFGTEVWFALSIKS
jgi:signal transduction histidine kinase